MIKGKKFFDNFRDLSISKTSLVVLFLIGVVVLFMFLFQQSEDRIKKQIVPAEMLEQKRKDQLSNQNERFKDAETIPVSALLFDSENLQTIVGEKISLNVMIDPNGEKVSATELHIDFDPKILKIESVTPSDVFSEILSESKIDNEKGKVSIVLGAKIGSPSVESTASIVTLNVQALSAGYSKISFTDESVASADGEIGNVVSLRKSSMISVR